MYFQRSRRLRYLRPCPAQGSLRLRQAIAAYLRAMRGMEVDPACIVVRAGAQVLDDILTQLLGQHLTYAVEDPGYVRLTRIYQAMGCQVRHIGLDVAGPRMDELEASCAHVLHLMPSHQFPTGRVTSIARRYELLAWAAASTYPDANAAAGGENDTANVLTPHLQERYVIENDHDCEFRFLGRPVPVLASIDATGRVIYTNTFSRSIGTALRLAYMVLPQALMEKYQHSLGFLLNNSKLYRPGCPCVRT